MASLGFTLADRLGAKSMPCSVRGCTRTWLRLEGKSAKLGGRAAPDEQDPTSKMCDPCRDKHRTLKDAERPCDRPGCAGTWHWSAEAQLEAFAAGRQAPRQLCAEDEARLASLVDREVPCEVPGCTRHATFTRRQQLLAGVTDSATAELPATKCGPCANVFEKLNDRQVTCGIRGCKQKWTWSKVDQIEDYAAGLPNEPPRRLCDSCRATFGGIADREIRCRTSGCKNTWTWPREHQLDAAVAGKPLPKAPHRMCQRCIELYSSLKDVERPCRRPGRSTSFSDE